MEWDDKEIKRIASSLAEEKMRKAGPGREDIGLNDVLDSLTLFWMSALKRVTQLKEA